MTLKPLRDEVLVKDEPGPSVLRTPSSGLCLPSSHPSGTARVIAAGKDCDLELKTGRRILTKPFGGREVEWLNQKFRLLKPEDILGIEL